MTTFRLTMNHKDQAPAKVEEHDSGPIRVLMVQKVIPFYRGAIYRRLVSRFNVLFVHSGQDVEALPSATGLEISSTRTRVLSRLGSRQIIWMELGDSIRRFEPNVVITDCALTSLHTWMLFIWRWSRDFRLVFWTHGFERYRWTRPTLSVGDQIRLLWFRWSDGLIFYSERGRSEVLPRLSKGNLTFVAPNTNDTESLNAVHAQLQLRGREAVRRQLNLSGFSLVFLGRLVPYKEIGTLVKIVEALAATDLDFSLDVIGDGPDRSIIDDLRRRYPKHVRLHGLVTDTTAIGALLFGCDVMVCPGSLGLNVVDAFAFGCPVATTDDRRLMLKHGPEAEYLSPGRNSIVAPTPEALIDEIAVAAANPAVLRAMRDEARRTFETCCDIGEQERGVVAAVVAVAGDLSAIEMTTVLPRRHH